MKHARPLHRPPVVGGEHAPDRRPATAGAVLLRRRVAGRLLRAGEPAWPGCAVPVSDACAGQTATLMADRQAPAEVIAEFISVLEPLGSRLGPSTAFGP